MFKERDFGFCKTRTVTTPEKVGYCVINVADGGELRLKNITRELVLWANGLAANSFSWVKLEIRLSMKRRDVTVLQLQTL